MALDAIELDEGTEPTNLTVRKRQVVAYVNSGQYAQEIARVALALGDARAEAVCLLLWTDGERAVMARGATAGELVLPARGVNGFGWDPVFVPLGESRSYGELSDDEKDRIGHRGRAWRELLKQLAGTPQQP